MSLMEPLGECTLETLGINGNGKGGVAFLAGGSSPLVGAGLLGGGL